MAKLEFTLGIYRLVYIEYLKCRHFKYYLLLNANQFVPLLVIDPKLVSSTSENTHQKPLKSCGFLLLRPVLTFY